MWGQPAGTPGNAGGTGPGSSQEEGVSDPPRLGHFGLRKRWGERESRRGWIKKEVARQRWESRGRCGSGVRVQRATPERSNMKRC